MPHSRLNQLYPKMNDFRKLATEFDPGGKFKCFFLNRIFSGYKMKPRAYLPGHLTFRYSIYYFAFVLADMDMAEHQLQRFPIFHCFSISTQDCPHLPGRCGRTKGFVKGFPSSEALNNLLASDVLRASIVNVLPG